MKLSVMLFVLLLDSWSGSALAKPASASQDCVQGQFERCVDVEMGQPDSRASYKRGCSAGYLYSCLLYKLSAENGKQLVEAEELLAKVCQQIDRFQFAPEALCPKSTNPYEDATPSQIRQFKKVGVPFKSGTRFYIFEGAYGRSSFHRELGYVWDLTAPLGVEVLSVADGTVIHIQDYETGGCDPRYLNLAGVVRVKHVDGTVAHYGHVRPLVKPGDGVKKGQVVGAINGSGYVCMAPHVNFGVLKGSDRDSHDKYIPIFFEGIPGGILKTDSYYLAP